MSDRDFKRTLDYAQSALDLLAHGRIPPSPRHFELLYAYVTGVNPNLNRRLNRAFRNGAVTPALLGRLHEEFVQPADGGAGLLELAPRLSERVGLMQDIVEATMAAANAYAASLKATNGDLSRPLEEGELRSMVQRLLLDTRRMQDAGVRLEHKLELARSEITALRAEIDERQRESLLDPLTKLPGRKAFDEALADGLAEADRLERSLCLLLVDVDDFHQFNARWGYQTGDQVLRLLAMTVRSCVGPDDIAARFAGDRFAVILPGAELRSALLLAEAIGQKVQSRRLLRRSTSETLGRITVSSGVALARRGDGPAQLMSRIEQCLFAAHEAGGNRVVSDADMRDAVLQVA